MVSKASPPRPTPCFVVLGVVCRDGSPARRPPALIPCEEMRPACLNAACPRPAITRQQSYTPLFCCSWCGFVVVSGWLGRAARLVPPPRCPSARPSGSLRRRRLRRSVGSKGASLRRRRLRRRRAGRAVTNRTPPTPRN